MANPLPKKPSPPTRRAPLVSAPNVTPDDETITIEHLTDIPADLGEELRPDRDLVSWLDRMEKNAVERICKDLENLDMGYCRKVTAVRQSSITTLKKKYILADKDKVCVGHLHV